MRIPQLRRWSALTLAVAALASTLAITFPAPAAKADPAFPADVLVLKFTTTTVNEDVQLGFSGTIQNIKIIWQSGDEDVIPPQTNGGLVTMPASLSTPGTNDVVITKDDVNLPATLSGFGTNNRDGSCATPTNAANLTSIEQWGTLGITDLTCMAYQRSGLTSVPSTLPIGVTSLASAFDGASSFNQSIAGWDLSQVTSTARMFQGAFAFNQPIGTWDMSGVTDMSSMFHIATSFNRPLGQWDVSRVTNMSGLFEFAMAFNQDLSGWSTQQVASMNSTFRGAYAFNNGGQPLSWNTARVTDMTNMFSLATVFNQSVAGFNTASVLSLAGMFSGTSAFNQDISSWNTSSVTSFSDMFRDSRAFNQDIGNWNTGAALILDGMFQNAGAFNYPLPEWNIASVLDMADMFTGSVISDANYSDTLIGWASQSLRPNVRLDASAQAITCEAITARATMLASPNLWTINDIAPTLNCGSSNGGDELARTGSDAQLLGLVALALLALGGLLSLRRRVTRP